MAIWLMKLTIPTTKTNNLYIGTYLTITLKLCKYAYYSLLEYTRVHRLLSVDTDESNDFCICKHKKETSAKH